MAYDATGNSGNVTDAARVVRELADMAKVSTNTITRFERGEPLKERTRDAIRAALESGGVEFTNGDQPGVRLKARG